MTPRLKPQAKGPDQGGAWAVFGGVFDPVHRGHFALIDDLYATGRFDGVLFVPSFHPPHKGDRARASYDDRIAMLELALEDRDHYLASRIESELQEPGYTLNVVKEIKKRYPAARFSFIIGADNIADMRNWHRPEEVLKEIHVIAGARPGFDPQQMSRFPGERIEYVRTRTIDISSSDVRNRIAQGITLQELAEMVPDKVARYILERNLYR